MRDLTKGSPRKVILLFAIPVLIGYLLQLCYSLTDTKIVSSLLGEDAFSAVGATSSLSNMVIGFLNGLTGGFAVIIARHFGAGDIKKLKRTVAATLTLGLIMSVALTLIMVLGLPFILNLINTPKDIYPIAYRYISIIFGGMTMSMLYNVSASILRAVGDTFTPMMFLFLSVVLNIFGDLFFIKVVGMGVEGAACATVLAQTVAMTSCFIYMWKKYEILRVKKENFNFDRRLIKSLMNCGLSMGFMSCLINIGSVSLQSGINGLGKPYIAAHTAARKITEIYMMMFAVLGGTTATYCSQNFGAGDIKRIKQGIVEIMRICLTWCALVAVASYTVAPYIIGFVAGDISQFSRDTAALYLKVDSLFYSVTAFICMFRNALQGVGDHITPIVSSTIECLGKIVIVIILVPPLGYWGVIWAEPIVWFLMVIPLIFQMIKKWKSNFALELKE